MKKAIGIIIAVLIVLAGIYWTYQNQGKYGRVPDTDDTRLYDLELEEKEILKGIKKDSEKFDSLVKDLQLSANDLLKLNAMLIKLSYQLKDNGKLSTSDDDIKLMAKVQRLFYSEKLLKENPEDSYYDEVIKDIRKANENKSYIIDYAIREPLVEVDGQIVANVKYLLNGRSTDGNMYQQYLLQKADGRWYIEGWRGITKEDYEYNR